MTERKLIWPNDKRHKICTVLLWKEYKNNDEPQRTFSAEDQGPSPSFQRCPGVTSMKSFRENYIWGSKYTSRSCSPCLKLTYSHHSIQAATSSRSLTERHITHIISVCPDPIPAELPESGIHHLRIPIDDVDYADLLIYLPSACHFIDQAMQMNGVCWYIVYKVYLEVQLS